MQSPVWVNYDPSYETTSIPSDWEYYSDDYWDAESTKKRKRKSNATEITAAGGGSIGHGTERKRIKLVRTVVPGISLGEPAVAAPTVIWKSKNDVLQPSEGPIVSEGQGERVSLLKDWRVRFKVPFKQKSPVSRPFEMQGVGSQKAIAVVVTNQSATRIFGDALPPTAHSKSQGLPSRSKEARSKTAGTSRAKNQMTRNKPFQDVTYKEKFQTRPVDGVASAKSRKRKAPDPSGTPLTVTRAAMFKKRKATSIGGNIGMTESQRPIESQRRARKKTALGSDERILEVSDVANGEAAPSGRKRKAESEHELLVDAVIGAQHFD